MNKKVFRYLPQGNKNDPFETMSIGEIVNSETVLDILNQQI